MCNKEIVKQAIMLIECLEKNGRQNDAEFYRFQLKNINPEKVLHDLIDFIEWQSIEKCKEIKGQHNPY